MGYADDPYIDEDGEPLVDFDNLPPDGGSRSPDRNDDNFLDDDIDEWAGHKRDRSPDTGYDEDKSGRPRKRLIKKGDAGNSEQATSSRHELYDDDIVEDRSAYTRTDDGAKKKKRLVKDQGKGKMKLSKAERRFSSGSGNGRASRAASSSRKKSEFGESYAARDEGDVKEMWDTVAGGDSEDDVDGARTIDDDNFIDDSGLDPNDRYGSDNEARSPGDAPQAEEGDDDQEINSLFKMGKKKKKNERSPAEIALLVEKVMAELEVTAEDDAELNRQGKPAINKLKKLPLLTEVLSKKQLQQEFIDHGVLTLLKTWLEPLPDGSLPNINIRAAILKILADFPIDLEQYDRREQLKRSGLGKVIMFLSKSEEETTSNRKLAKELVDKWSRPIFNKSTRFEDMRNANEEQAFRRPVARRPTNNVHGVESRDGDLDLDISRERRSSQSSSRLHASRPEATPMDYVVRPQSKVDPDEVRARAKQIIHDQRRMKMNKKLQQLKAPKKRQLQATKLSVEGRGMLKYL